MIGSMEDLERRDDRGREKFFKMYYAPNNAVIAIVGDFDTAEDEWRSSRSTSGSRGGPRGSGRMTEPGKKGERRAGRVDKMARLPALTFACTPCRRTETRGHAGAPRLVIATILGQGEELAAEPGCSRARSSSRPAPALFGGRQRAARV